jgi:hypothetical protein
MSIDIESLTVKEVREIASLAGCGFQRAAEHPWRVGSIYLIRTVTMIQTGRLKRVTAQELVLEDAAWIADTGRFAGALVSGDFGEVEPFPTGDVIVGRGSVIDAVIIPSAPRSQK